MHASLRLVGFGAMGAATLFSLTALTAPGSESEKKKPSAVVWRKQWTEALKEAGTKQQPILLVVAFPSCKWWLRMDRTTFTDERVQTMVASTVPALLHGDEEGLLFEKFKVSECPLIAIFDATGMAIARVQGFQEVEPFRAWLKANLTKARKKANAPKR